MPEEFQSEPRFAEIIGTSPELKLALALAQSAAVSDNPVFILGETGSGKKLIARAIHQSSARRNNAFIRIDCAAALPKLLEMELFGHETNSLDGGSGEKSGHLELADKGTLFLDEIADLPLDIQHRLLRVLERREFERLGGGRTFRVNLRWIAASRHDLRQRVAERRFLGDLYDQLRGFSIYLPPLRHRCDDIPMLVRYFVQRYARRMSKEVETVPSEIIKALQNRDWPGNVRELETFVERSVALTKGSTLVASLDGEHRKLE